MLDTAPNATATPAIASTQPRLALPLSEQLAETLERNRYASARARADELVDQLREHLEAAIAGRELLDPRLATVIATSRGRLLSAARVSLLEPPPLPTCNEYQRRRALAAIGGAA